MRISFLLPSVGMSGGIRVVSIYAKWLADRGHVVTLISRPPRPLGLRKKISSLLKGNGWPTPPHPGKSHLCDLGLNHIVIDSWRVPNDNDVPDGDVVIATWWETAEWAYALGPTKGAKVYFVQGHEVFDFLPVERCRATYQMPLHKIVVSRWLAEIMHREYGSTTVDIVHNAIDHSQFYAETRDKQVVPTVGFLYHEAPPKGLDVILASLSKLRVKFRDLRVICFGSCEPSGIYDIPDFVEFHLSPPQDQLRHLYGQCDVWLSASRSEGFNLTAVEAMACRVPLVSTRTGWPDEAVVAGRNGVLVDIDDVDGMVSGAEWLLSLDNNAWRFVSDCAYRTVEESTWENSAQLFEQALTTVCIKERVCGKRVFENL